MILEDRTQELLELHRRTFPPQPEAPPAAPATPSTLSDEDIIRRASSSSNSGRFKSLWAGEWKGAYPSQSEADEALCCHLAFWCGRDESRIESLFRQSGLASTLRRKAKPTDYLSRTIKGACAHTTDTYQPKAPQLELDADEYVAKVTDFFRKQPKASRPEAEPEPQITRGEATFNWIASHPPESFGNGPIEYVIHPEIPEGCLCFISGKPGCGKSTLVTFWADEAAKAGRPVLFLDHDNSRPFVQHRINNVCRGALPSNVAFWGLWSLDTDGEPFPLPKPSDSLLMELVRSQVKPLIIFDTFISFAGCDENDNTAVQRVLADMRRLTSCGATVIVIHHATKDGSSPYRGASSIEGHIDVGLFVEGKQDADLKLTFINISTFKPRLEAVNTSYRMVDGRPVRLDKDSTAAPNVADRLYEFLQRNPGFTKTKFEKRANAAGIKGATIQAIRDFLVKGLLIGKIEYRDNKLSFAKEPTANVDSGLE